MNEQIKQIAERLAGLRDALEISPEEMAKGCHLTTGEYLALESGTVDISVSVLHQISQAYGVELTTLMSADEPKMSTYFITRKGKGVAVERPRPINTSLLPPVLRRVRWIHSSSRSILSEMKRDKFAGHQNNFGSYFPNVSHPIIIKIESVLIRSESVLIRSESILIRREPVLDRRISS